MSFLWNFAETSRSSIIKKTFERCLKNFMHVPFEKTMKTKKNENISDEEETVAAMKFKTEHYSYFLLNSSLNSFLNYIQRHI